VRARECGAVQASKGVVAFVLSGVCTPTCIRLGAQPLGTIHCRRLPRAGLSTSKPASGRRRTS
jgi:hypothetical protein